MRYGWLTDAALLLSIAGNDDWRCVASTGFVALRLVARAALCRRGAHKTARSSPRSKRLPTPIARIGDCPKRSLGDVLGGGKSNFLIRDIDGPTRTAASVESCQFVARRSLGGRIGSVLDVGNRLPRVRGRSHRWIPMRTGAQLPRGLHHDPQSFRSRALWRAPSAAACGLGDRPTSDLSQRESESRSTSEKSKQFGPDGAPFP